MLSLYTPVKNALRQTNGNVDNEEHLQVLTTYKQCMLKGFKKNANAAATLRAKLKDQLMKSRIYSNECHREAEKSLDLVQANACYNLCGYLIHTREDQINCSLCLESLSTTENEIPNDFYASYITSAKSKGFLRFASLGMFHTFAKVEKQLQKHFKSEEAYLRDSFEMIVNKMAQDGLGLPNIGCHEHRTELVPFLIYEYLEIRYHLEAKRYKNELLEKLKVEQHKLRKLSKLV